MWGFLLQKKCLSDCRFLFFRCRGLEPIVRHLKGLPEHNTSSHKRRECGDCLEVRRMAIRVVSIISGDADIRKEIRNHGI